MARQGGTAMAALRKAAGPTPAVRVSSETHARLLELARDENRPMGEIVTDLVAEYRTRRFWDAVNASLDRLHADPEAWQDYQDELGQFQAAPNAELAAEPPYGAEEERRGARARAGGR